MEYRTTLKYKINLMKLFTKLITLWLIFDNTRGITAEDGNTEEVTVDASQSLVWGPGLKPDVVLPARYFQVHLVDKNGNNITHSMGEDPFAVSIQNPAGRARVWVRIADRRDGSYVVQYKLYNSFDSLTIAITINGQHVAKSPYVLSGYVCHEKCDCPQRSLETWMSTMSCGATFPQIEQDLEMFPNISMSQVVPEVIQRFNQRSAHSLCHYVIKDNKIYRTTYGEHVGFKMFTDAMFLSLTRKVHLPDVEFFVNLGDWPLVKHKKPHPVPILSWCGSDDTYDIVMPTYDVTESTLETMGRVSLDLVSVQGADTPQWQDKVPVGFWRGRDSRQERLDLVRMSHKHPDLIDARLTNMFFFKQEKDLGELVKHISFFDFFKYKYQINLDGTVAAYRFPYLLGGNAVVLKQESPYYEHFYKSVKPYEHYIPFKRDLSDLMDIIKWAKENDDKVQQISKNARMFVRENLMAEDIYCYHAALFKAYAERLTEPVEVREGMELVEQPSDHDSKCDCVHNSQALLRLIHIVCGFQKLFMNFDQKDPLQKAKQEL